jgi:hypothetical protein
MRVRSQRAGTIRFYTAADPTRVRAQDVPEALAMAESAAALDAWCRRRWGKRSQLMEAALGGRSAAYLDALDGWQSGRQPSLAELLERAGRRREETWRSVA